MRQPHRPPGQLGREERPRVEISVALDVPRFRGEPFVTQDRPIHGWELEDIVKAEQAAVNEGAHCVLPDGAIDPICEPR